ncbi:MAG: hypothetical protein KDK06_20625 [Gammaproteobacteria bacterium]|nr:hypothetical protein [Gammaproteobacteria bacterium]
MPILDDRHDLGHPVEDDPDWSESYYFNGYDPQADCGFFARLAVRPNEPHADAFVSLWLPGGDGARLAAARTTALPEPGFPALDTIHAERLVPMQRWRLAAHGRADDGRDLAFEATFEALSPPVGVDAAGRRVADATGAAVTGSLASGHFAQAGRWAGRVSVAGADVAFAGRGNRDKSWGPRRTDGGRGMRYWRWFSMNFADDLHLGGIRVGTADGTLERGWLYRDGAVTSLRGMTVTTRLAADGLRQQGVTLLARDKAGGEHRFDGEVLRSVPLLARGHEHMAVFEGLTRWQHGETIGYGICEYAHQLDADGRPLTPIE